MIQYRHHDSMIQHQHHDRINIVIHFTRQSSTGHGDAGSTMCGRMATGAARLGHSLD